MHARWPVGSRQSREEEEPKEPGGDPGERSGQGADAEAWSAAWLQNNMETELRSAVGLGLQDRDACQPTSQLTSWGGNTTGPPRSQLAGG